MLKVYSTIDDVIDNMVCGVITQKVYNTSLGYVLQLKIFHAF